MTIPQRGGLPHSDIHGSKPARGSPWLFAACHVLHRLLVPRHPPNALLSLKIYPRALVPGIHHAQKPSSGNSRQFFSRQLSETTATQHQPTLPENDPVLDHLAQHTTDASEHIATVAGGPLPTRTLARERPHPVRRATAARPETHQNLIHSNKEHAPDIICPKTSYVQERSNGIARPSTEQLVETTCPATIPATPNLVLLRDTTSWAGQSGSICLPPPQHHPQNPGTWWR